MFSGRYFLAGKATVKQRMSAQVASSSVMPDAGRGEWEFMSNEMFSAMQMIREDELARRAFELVRQASGTLSGWDLARALEIDPDKAGEILQKLRAVGVVKSSGEGLEGYYYLTDLGFRVQLIRAA